MKLYAYILSTAVLLLVKVTLYAQASIPADFDAIIGTTAGKVTDRIQWPGYVLVYGRASFPVLADPQNVPVLAAGTYNDGVSPTAARAVAAAYSGFLDNRGTSTSSQLFLNSVLWVSRKPDPATITVGSNNASIRDFLKAKGYLTKAIDTSMASTATDLSACDVFIGNFHDNFTAGALTKIKAFTAAGGGLVAAATPWLLKASARASVNEVLDPFGLVFNGVNAPFETFEVPSDNFPTNLSAIIALDQMVSDAQGNTSMDLAAKRAACSVVTRVLNVYPTQVNLAPGFEILHGLYGWIAPTKTAPFAAADLPVQALLLRYQSAKLDALPPADLFVHPSASDLPGLPDPGAIRVTRSVTINGNTAPSSYLYMQDAARPTRIETGLYAGPGELVTITLPADKTAVGLKVHIGGTEDTIFNLSPYNSYPKLWRRQDLTAINNQIGHALGGLITLLVPPGSALGNFDITIANALPAPCFTLGTDTNTDWNNTLKNNPAPWGFVRTPKLTIYLSKSRLQAVSDMEAIAQHWNTVMNTADEYYGYAPYRQRGEVIATNRQTAFGAAYAGYPIEIGWGIDSDMHLTRASASGSWGDYHELGHTFQANFNQAFRIATHLEIDVNLFPALIYTLVHDQTTWDDTGPHYGAAARTTKRANFLARPAAERTWAVACDTYIGPAYDFYFNLSDAFGWTAYRTALGRLMRWLQGQPDAELTALNSSDPNYKRNRFYLLFCDATGRNLDEYFQRYGLGVPGLGFEITQTVKDAVAAKGYPVWTDNQPLTSLTNPGAIDILENTMPGTVIVPSLPATDPEPGTIFTYSITSGNDDGTFAINKRTGAITLVRAVDFETKPTYELTVLCQDNGVPRYSLSQTLTVNLTNIVEPTARHTFAVLTASSSQSVGAVIGPVVRPDSAVTINASVVSGAPSGAFTINAIGQLVLANPAALPALPSAALLTLVVHGTDSLGVEFNSSVRVLVNTPSGLTEQRWAGFTNFNNNNWSGNPNYTGTLASATTLQDVSDYYSRRVTGWLVPPVSGDYTFWISSDDSGRLYLGTDASEASRVQLVSFTGYTGYQSFDAYPSQKSTTVSLVAGRAYWLEAQQQDNSGGDHLSVAWQGPGVATRSIITSPDLIPAVSGITPPSLLPRPPAFASTPIIKADATASQPYSGSLAADASDPDAGDTLTFRKVSGPAWLSVAANGALTGKPSQANTGPNSFTISVTDLSKNLVTNALHLNVIGPDPAADPDGDGISNLMEYALGSDPTKPDSTAIQTTVDSSRKALVLTFQRSDTAETDVVLSVRYAHDLSATTAWQERVIGRTSGTADAQGVTYTVAENGTAPDLITVTVPLSTSGRAFAQLRVTTVP